jgi:hypothetical protein
MPLFTVSSIILVILTSILDSAVHGFKLAPRKLHFVQEPAAEFRYIGAGECSSLPSAHVAFQSASVQLHHQCAIIQLFIRRHWKRFHQTQFNPSLFVSQLILMLWAHLCLEYSLPVSLDPSSCGVSLGLCSSPLPCHSFAGAILLSCIMRVILRNSDRQS